MTWDEVYAAYPVVPAQGYTANANVPPTTLTGHTVQVGSQWNFNADELSPFAKWSMEDL